MGAVKNNLLRDGLDPSIMDIIETKSVASQLKGVEEVLDDDPPLGEDLKYVYVNGIILLTFE
jgi:hypothetical protein